MQNLAFAYNANDLVTSITNSVQTSSNQTYAYDNMSRLITANGGAAGSQSYLYDLNGNRTSHTWSSATDILNIAAGSNKLDSISGTRARSFVYDAVGNVITETQNSVATTSIYNSSNRLWLLKRPSPVSVCRPTGQCFNLVAGNWQYDYNALGQRVTKITSLPNGTVVARKHFLFDPAGQLVAEANGDTGVVDSTYIWLGNEPLALIRGTNLYNIHSDQLGRPEKVTNSAKTVVWKAENFAFDRNVTLDNIGGLNLGFPGQYYHQESEAYYNYFRNYDASLGRYSNSDPVGLSGGLNTYAYVNNSPTSTIDPYGLDGIVVRGIVRSDSANVFGHIGMGITDAGMFSYGNSTNLGSGVLAYIVDQRQYRDQFVTIVPMTKQQDAAALKYFGKHPERNDVGYLDNCAVRTSSALIAAGFDFTTSHFPATAKSSADSVPGAQTFFIPQNGEIPAELFELLPSFENWPDE